MKLLSNTRPPSADSAAEPSSTSLQNKHSRATRVSLSPRAKKKKELMAAGLDRSWDWDVKCGSPVTGTSRQRTSQAHRCDCTKNGL